MVSTFSGYNHFRTFMAFSDCNTNSYASRMAWQYNYNQILACNTAIGDINADTTDPTVQFYLGQALAMRANAYFTLAQLFQFPYVGHESDACVMLITEKNQEEVLRNGTPRATVEQVYGLISSDLDRAIELISASGIRPEQVLENKPKRFVSLATAYGLRARVNLVKEQWADAATDARDAIDAFAGRPLTMAEAAMPGFNSIDAANWMWGIAISESDEVVQTGICNFPSHMGSGNYAYATDGAGRGINRKLFGEMPE
ncbi:MAG: RagB/SusD family nutrient uptake outer membrane protein, partial [Muribaculaceae bacterium]|nr:RagB/SusD family nutrient uptake outer membrane protein [Muribaculaceae bacterium]